MGLRPTALILYGKRAPKAVPARQMGAWLTWGKPMELDEIGLPAEAQPKAVKAKAAGDLEARARLRFPGIGPFVQVPALDCERILDPHLLEMDQGALPLAEQQVLERRERQQVVFRDAYQITAPPSRRNRSFRSTPAI